MTRPNEFTNQTVTPRVLSRIFLLPIYLLIQWYREILFILARRRSRGTAKKISSEGFVIFSELISEIQIKTVKIEIKKILAQNDLRPYAKLEIPGSMRLKGLQKNTLISETLSGQVNQLRQLAHEALGLTSPNVSIMYSETTVLGNDQPIFASYTHFDTYRHQLKAMIALDGISIDNGPVAYAPNTSQYHFSLIFYYFVSYLSVNRLIKPAKPIWPSSDELERKLLPITLVQGEAVVFNSRGFHRAMTPTSGSRKVLWIYLD